jgi:CheY-like chemotaxis protein
MQPTVTVLREHHPAQTAAITDQPSQSVSEPAHITAQADPAPTRQARGLGRVLVVDDDEVIRLLIAANLTLEGFDVATAVDGQDCLEKASGIAPDVITLDAMMPRLDGWETARRLRQCPDTSHIKVVLITARDQDANPAAHKHARAHAYLAKPFDPAEMIRIVRALADATGNGEVSATESSGLRASH